MADVVVFDPKTFRDSATFDRPTVYARGVRDLFVNGVPAIRDGKVLGKLAGRGLKLNQDGPADRILKAQRIWTGDGDHPEAEAIAIRAGSIASVGSFGEMGPFRGPKTVVDDLADSFVMPGLIDAHGHVAELGGGAGADRPARGPPARKRSPAW